ncbi:MAG TPA: glycosyltransferase family 39 protein [Verrucomicrobiae bacterium]|nr:glycosyltransferase family 39 protein [Verrucomicrobiae bacterium]
MLSAYLPPGAPAFYAAFFAAFGRNYSILRVAQCFIGAATAILLYMLASAIGGEAVGWLAAVAFCFYPSAVFYTNELLTETLFVFLFMLFVWLCVARFAVRPSWGTAIPCGLVWGLATLVRPAMTSYLLFLILWGVLTLRGWRARALLLAMIAVGFAVVLPWSWRNCRLYHRFVLVTPTAWTVFIQGNNPVVANDPKYAGFCVWYTQVPGWEHKFDGVPQIEREPIAKHLGTQWLSEHRDKWGYLVRSKFIRFWSPFLHQDNRANRLIMLFSWGPVLVLFVPGFFMSLVRFWRSRSPSILIHLLIISSTLNAVIYFGLARYRYPIEPFCLILASGTAIWLWERTIHRPCPTDQTP